MIAVRMKYKKSTKHTRVWEAEDEQAPVRVVYVSSPTAKSLPEVITLRIEWADDHV